MAKAQVQFDPSQVKVARQLIFPTLQLKPGVDIFAIIREPMHEGRQQEEDAGAAVRGPATIIRAKCLFAGKDNANNGQECQIVANKLLVGALRDNYPNDSYVGRAFKFTKSLEKKKGKKGEYFTFNVEEIENPE